MIVFLTNIIIAKKQFREIKDAINEFSELQLFAYVLNFLASIAFNSFSVKISLMFVKATVTALQSILLNENSILINRFERRVLKEQ